MQLKMIWPKMIVAQDDILVCITYSKPALLYQPKRNLKPPQGSPNSQEAQLPLKEAFRESEPQLGFGRGPALCRTGAREAKRGGREDPRLAGFPCQGPLQPTRG